ncbi:negative regulation of ATP citrate synthase [Balamuthia mandrillaris]
MRSNATTLLSWSSSFALRGAQRSVGPLRKGGVWSARRGATLGDGGRRELSFSGFCRFDDQQQQHQAGEGRLPEQEVGQEEQPPSVYELRTYTLNPKDYPSFLALTNEQIGLRMSHSKLVGYFTTEIGGINEVVHLWEYNNLSHRQRVREALGKDVTWNENYMAKMRPMLQKQENMLLEPLSIALKAPLARDTTASPPPPRSVYELTVQKVRAEIPNEIIEYLLRATEMTNPVGAWASQIGKIYRLVLLHQFEDFDQMQLEQLTTRDNKEFRLLLKHVLPYIVEEETKLILPTPFSPLQ